MSAGFAHRLLRRRRAVVALALIAVAVVACAAAPLFAPDDPLHQNLADGFATPSSGHLLGTDGLGRDLLSRLMYGGRVTLVGAGEALAVFLVLGVPIGLLAGYHRGRLDAIATQVTTVMLSVPPILLLLVVVAVFPGNQAAAMVTLGVLGAPGLFRVVRGSALAVSQELYVRAARTMGLSSWQIVRRHVAPALAGPVIVQASLFAAAAVLTESGLAFLGFSVQPPQPSWGGMVAEASAVTEAHPWLLVPPGVTIGLVVLAFGLLGDAARDAAVAHGTPAARRRAAPVAPAAAVTPRHAAEPGALLSIRDLGIAFGGDGAAVTVVSDFELDVRRGQVLGIVGESGSGKTVVARAVLGLLPAGGRITSGSIHFDGQDLVRMGERRMRTVRGARIGLVPQEPVAALDPAFTVGQQLIEVVRRHRGGTRREARDRAVELLKMVNLPQAELLAGRYPHQLSGGMAQRVAVAIALAGDPALLIADEPTTALDVTVQAEILQLLAGLRRRSDMAIVIITHDWGVLADVCDDAVVMYAGEIVESADVPTIFGGSRHPYTRALIAADASNVPRHATLPAIPGQVPSPAAWPRGCRFAPRCALAGPECRQDPIPLVAAGAEAAHSSRCVHSEQLAIA